jgi:hypothetical protein
MSSISSWKPSYVTVSPHTCYLPLLTSFSFVGERDYLNYLFSLIDLLRRDYHDFIRSFSLALLLLSFVCDYNVERSVARSNRLWASLVFVNRKRRRFLAFSFPGQNMTSSSAYLAAAGPSINAAANDPSAHAVLRTVSVCFLWNSNVVSWGWHSPTICPHVFSIHSW